MVGALLLLPGSADGSQVFGVRRRVSGDVLVRDNGAAEGEATIRNAPSKPPQEARHQYAVGGIVDGLRGAGAEALERELHRCVVRLEGTGPRGNLAAGALAAA